jgi:hypothetical protein
MTKISARQRVAAPLASADRLLRWYFAQHPGPDGSARIVLRGAGLERAAIVTVTPDHRPGDMEPRYHVHWEAEGDGPYPVFDGTLSVGADEDYNTFVLDLDGGYEPPMGLVGKTFDLVVGHRIAEETVRALLTEIQREIETKFNAEESAKR